MERPPAHWPLRLAAVALSIPLAAAIVVYLLSAVPAGPGEVGRSVWLVRIGLTLLGLTTVPFALTLALRAGHRADARVLGLYFALGGYPPAFLATHHALTRFGFERSVEWSTAITAVTFALAIGAMLHFSMVFPYADGNAPRAATGADTTATQHLVRDPRLAWGAAVILLVLFLTRAIPFTPGPSILLYSTAAALTALNVRSAYARVDPEGRRRIFWVVEAVLAVSAILLLDVALLGATWLFGLDIPVPAWDLWLLIVAMFTGAALLAFAMFYDGALDPRLAIRKTTVYGAMGVLSLTLFVGAEAVATMRLAGALNLPQSVAPWMAAGSVAVVFQPLRRWVERRTQRVLDRLIPATALAEGEREEAVVVFADICGYTRISATDESAALTLASLLHTAARRAAERRGGRLVKTLGDGVVMAFSAAEPAVTAAVEARTRFRAAAEAMGLEVPELRCGVNRGAVARGRDGDIFGAAVNLASRLESAAEPGDVLVSGAVADAMHGAPGWLLEPAGERTLKNVPEPVPTFRCLPREAGAG